MATPLAVPAGVSVPQVFNGTQVQTTPRCSGSFDTVAMIDAVAFTARADGGSCVMNNAMGCVFPVVLPLPHEDSRIAAPTIAADIQAACFALALPPPTSALQSPIFPKLSGPLDLKFLLESAFPRHPQSPRTSSAPSAPLGIYHRCSRVTHASGGVRGAGTFDAAGGASRCMRAIGVKALRRCSRAPQRDGTCGARTCRSRDKERRGNRSPQRRRGRRRYRFR